MMLDRKTPPKIYDAIDFDFSLPPINKYELRNGLPVYWLTAGVQEVVEIDFVFPAGIWQEQKPGVSNMVATLLKSGTSKRTAQEINEALEFYGAVLKVNPGNDYCTVSVYSLTKHLIAILPIIHEILTDAAFPGDELAINKQIAIQKLLVSLRQCEFVSNQKIDAVIFGEEHPYGRYSKKENIESVTREDLLQFYNHYYALPNMQIFMAGNIGQKEVKLLDDFFGGDYPVLVSIDGKTPIINADANRKFNITNDPNGVQGAIRIGKQFPNRLHPDFPSLVVLNTIYGGYFGSRLMNNIREDKGFTYGIYSSLSPYLYEGTFIIHTEVGRDVIEPALKEIYYEMQLMREQPVDEEELLLVKNFLLGNLLGDLDGPFSILSRWRTLILNNMSAEHFNRNVNVYKTVTANDLQELANKYFIAEDMYEVVVV